MRERPSLDEIFKQPATGGRPSLDEIFAQPAPEVAAPQEEVGFIDAMRQRGAKLADIAYSEDEPASKVFQGVMSSGVGAPFEAAGFAARGLYDTLMTEKGKQKIAGELEAVGQSGVGQTLGRVGEQMSANDAAYARMYPERFRNIQAVRQGADLLPFGSSAVRQGVKAVASKGAQSLGSAGKYAVEKAKPLPPVPTYEGVKKTAQAGYKRAEELGGEYPESLTSQFLIKTDELKPEPIAGKVLTAPMKETHKMLSEYEGIKGSRLKLKDIQNIHTELGEKIEANIKITGKPNANGRRLIILQDELENIVSDLPESAVTGGKAGHDVLKKATKDWSTSLRLKEIERIIARAKNTDNEATSLKSGFRNLADNEKKMNLLTKAQQKAVRKIAKDGVIGGMFRNVFGSRLIGVMTGVAGGASGGLPGALGGAAAGAAVSAGSRGLATGMKMRKINKLRRDIGKNVGLEPTKK